MGCALCTAGTSPRSAKEGASVSDTPQNVYTEAQHFALLTSAVERETAQLAEAKESLSTQVQTLTSEKAALADELDTVKAKADVLEAEKAAAEARAEAAAKELEDFKAELALKAEVAEKKATRIERVKAANSALSTDYFTEERAQRWAEMSDETFEALVADLTEAAAAVKPATTPGDTPATELAKESAAFTGGEAPKAAADGSTLSSLLGATRRRRTA
jgi:chromosome segregation ATPase